MTNNDHIRQLQQQTELLIERCHQLMQQNHLLREQKKLIQQERDLLIQKNMQAKTKIQSIVNRLSTTEEPA